MSIRTCVIIGAGYAGIHAAKSIAKAFHTDLVRGRMRIVMIDKRGCHLRKVLLFKAAAGDESIAVQLCDILPGHIEFVHGEVMDIDPLSHKLQYLNEQGNRASLLYDNLVVAVGSIVKRQGDEQGGLALSDEVAAIRIREQWRSNMRQAVLVSDSVQRRVLLTAAVAGAGISGIETSAELVHAMKREASKQGISPEQVSVHLFNAHDRLFMEGPEKVGNKLERLLGRCGVQVHHRAKVLQAKNGQLLLSNGSSVEAGLCVWTLGLIPNPMLAQLKLPLTASGEVMVDGSYRVKGMKNVYCIGDCACITDPRSGRSDSKTCKEASAQAARLGGVMRADDRGKPVPSHRSYMDFYCFGLGPGKGLVWTRKWGIDIIIGGRIGWKVRKLTWDIASLIKK
ncbi:NAD(P)/FAD-dependent oxidoreductase [Paenibacillus tarimensis]|uniref:NAD(P)/FAD-dependent oxidoreductase n=1 Tax=Paenibacillus tarimensis TaxID=416012 RepID=UPI001F2F634F|nr:FAD-dependent oxidoreductase [Paenibacillus tarimensis]MCF2943280.1 FAD-dependent oxidoreductase [Paenibacillus tarimensis]